MPSDEVPPQAEAMTLYGDFISPYVRSCVVVAHELGLARRLRLVAADVPIASINEELASLSPIAQVPVLVTADGSVVHDSRVIIDFLCQQAENLQLLPQKGEARRRVLTLQALALSMADAAVGVRNEIIQRPAHLHWQAWLDRQRQRVEMSLDALEARWLRTMDALTVGSLTVAVTLDYLDLRFAEWSWRKGRPGLAAIHAGLAQRNSMKLTSPANLL
jgi:glutathione S-transferase